MGFNLKLLGSCIVAVASPTVRLLGRKSTQRLQYPLIKEYTLNLIGVPSII